jgi:hypothetical protein
MHLSNLCFLKLAHELVVVLLSVIIIFTLDTRSERARLVLAVAEYRVLPRPHAIVVVVAIPVESD